MHIVSSGDSTKSSAVNFSDSSSSRLSLSKIDLKCSCASDDCKNVSSISSRSATAHMMSWSFMSTLPPIAMKMGLMSFISEKTNKSLFFSSTKAAWIEMAWCWLCVETNNPKKRKKAQFDLLVKKCSKKNHSMLSQDATTKWLKISSRLIPTQNFSTLPPLKPEMCTLY